MNRLRGSNHAPDRAVGAPAKGSERAESAAHEEGETMCDYELTGALGGAGEPDQIKWDLSVPDENFLRSVFDELWGAVESCVRRDVSSDHKRSEEKSSLLMSMTRSSIEQFLTDHVLEPALWDSHLRFINAMRTMVKEDQIIFDNREDVELFRFLFRKDFSLLSTMVDHYVQTGEFMEAVKSVEEIQKLLIPSRTKHLYPAVSAFRVRMLRLYLYDMRRAQEHGEQDGADDFDLVPLDVRLNFSGFYGRVSDVETAWDFKTRNNKKAITEEQIISSFQALTRS